jgi:hypothetical protein
MTAVILPPYATALGMRIEPNDGGAPVIAQDFTSDVNGNRRAFHGGVLAGMLEIAALAALTAELDGGEGPYRLKPANVTVEYLRTAGVHTAYARGEVVRRGRRLAQLRASAWQESPDRPVAVGFINVYLAPPSGQE